MANQYIVEYPSNEQDLLEKINALQDQWRQSLKSEQDQNDFCYDGFYPFYTQQKVKVLFIGQESYGMGGCNYIEAFHQVMQRGYFNDGTSTNKSSFHRRIFYIAYGILKDFPAWQDVPYPTGYKDKVFTNDGISFAFMNISKISPDCYYRHTDWTDVMRSVREGASYIKKEVELLAPDILITMSFIGNQEIRQALFDGCEPIDTSNPNVHVYRARNGKKTFLVLDTWHFSALKKEFNCYYKPIRDIVKKYYYGEGGELNELEELTPQQDKQAPNYYINPRHKFISEIAEKCAADGSTMYIKELARLLNENNFRTGYNAEYAGGRGTYRLVQSAYWCYERMEEHEKARHIADVFVNANGKNVW